MNTYIKNHCILFNTSYFPKNTLNRIVFKAEYIPLYSSDIQKIIS